MKFHLMVAFMATALLSSGLACAQTPEEWVALVNRTHGRFDASMSLGIRIGVEALRQLNVQAQEITITYYGSESAARAKIADGVALAIPDAASLEFVQRQMPPGTLAIIGFRNSRNGRFLEYELRESSLSFLEAWDKELSPVVRFKTVIIAQGLYWVTSANRARF